MYIGYFVDNNLGSSGKRLKTFPSFRIKLCKCPKYHPVPISFGLEVVGI
ncbi:MAG: hypothetical protein CM1200mP37_7890 [Chloroflexota bacterium]|nr:MAG: hypothetical protein CM1200mP37_7890 [Chloroflexota bacterium]